MLLSIYIHRTLYKFTVWNTVCKQWEKDCDNCKMNGWVKIIIVGVFNKQVIENYYRYKL